MKSKCRSLLSLAVLALMLTGFATQAFAADSPDVAQRFSSADTIWVLLGAALVLFMQPGFAMCETGLTRAKNAGNIVMKNVMDFSIGQPLDRR